MQELIEKFRTNVIELSNTNKSFIHCEWFVKYHLEIVEKIALELCDIYTSADRDLVKLLVWLHDYGKIIDFTNQYTATRAMGRPKLLEFGFPQDLAEKAISYIETLDNKEGLASDATPIEIKIASSADGAAHLVGPFFYFYWYENSNKSIEDLMVSGREKSAKDWENKIVLPEVKKAFETRHNFLLEQMGNIPGKFFM
ncbi:MAG: hypothetical protein HYT37_01050 [Candidatus Sungbacteria bacterium]|nr:hypothetical protein [Candidatus Sungbacteria bacterium]